MIVARHKRLRQPPTARTATAAATRPRQPVIARPHVMLEPTDPERESDALEEVRADLAGVPGEGRGWHGSDER